VPTTMASNTSHRKRRVSVAGLAGRAVREVMV